MSMPTVRKVNKVIYIVLAIFLGGLGIHKFYANRTMAGIIYLLLSWTFIPVLLSIYDTIVAILKPADSDGNISF